MRIALAHAEDWQQWRTLRLAALAESPQAFGSRYAEWAQADEARWRQRLSHGQNWIASLDEPCAMVSGMPAGEGVNLIGLWVAPQSRRRGLAAALLETVIAWAITTGAAQVELEVKQRNHEARRIYTRRGFTFSRRVEDEDVLTLALRPA
ncbi:MAG TPA: GNAT family N-acetyltransferase [Polyangiales bacterium]|nr:GNAT family N-acetyltransferase [Polyangiales bacterium]